MALITFEEALGHLRVELDHDGGSPPIYDDERVPDINAKIVQANAIILDYLETDEASINGSPAPFTEQQIEVIRASIFTALSALYDDEQFRTLQDNLKMNTGAIPLMLMRLRTPTLR